MSGSPGAESSPIFLFLFEGALEADSALILACSCFQFDESSGAIVLYWIGEGKAQLLIHSPRAQNDRLLGCVKWCRKVVGRYRLELEDVLALGENFGSGSGKRRQKTGTVVRSYLAGDSAGAMALMQTAHAFWGYYVLLFATFNSALRQSHRSASQRIATAS